MWKMNTSSLEEHQDKAKEQARPLRTEMGWAAQCSSGLLVLSLCHFGTEEFGQANDKDGEYLKKLISKLFDSLELKNLVEFSN